MQGGMFLPTRHDPEACRLPDGRAAPPVVMYQDLEHYIPLVVQRPQDYWDWATTLLHGDTAALDALRWVHVNCVKREGRWIWSAGAVSSGLLSFHIIIIKGADLGLCLWIKPCAVSTCP